MNPYKSQYKDAILVDLIAGTADDDARGDGWYKKIGDNKWVTTRDLLFRLDDGSWWLTKAGFETDFFTIPKWLKYILRVEEKDKMASVFHDHAFREWQKMKGNILQKEARRARADRNFKAILKLLWDIPVRYRLIYFVIRISGWLGFYFNLKF